MRKILIMNGPNLNLLGVREPEVYGRATLADIMAKAAALCESLGGRCDHFQSNSEAALIERAHQAREDGTDWIVLNPGALTHTSVALRDALLCADKPFIEVHLSNVHARESFRRVSYLSDIARGVITGMGARGYEFAVMAAMADDAE